MFETTIGAEIMGRRVDVHGLWGRFLSRKSEGFQDDMMGLSGVVRGLVEPVPVLGFFLRCEL